MISWTNHVPKATPEMPGYYARISEVNVWCVFQITLCRCLDCHIFARTTGHRSHLCCLKTVISSVPCTLGYDIFWQSQTSCHICVLIHHTLQGPVPTTPNVRLDIGWRVVHLIFVHSSFRMHGLIIKLIFTNVFSQFSFLNYGLLYVVYNVAHLFDAS
jgi:hypothetical protein